MAVHNPTDIYHYPMGPKIRAFLDVSDDDYRGEQQPFDSESHRAMFVESVLKTIEDRPALNDDELTDLLDELVAMDLPDLVMKIVALRPSILGYRDFRCQLSIGVAAMLSENFELAEDGLRAAQEILPAEPAPYINIVQILLAQSRLDEALVWCESGLEAEPNNYSLWELMARIHEITDGESYPDMIMRLANRFNSWAGLSLAASLSSSGDRYLKLNLLEKLFAQGERDDQFLVEYTAALGVAGDMEKIPQVIWLAETARGGGQGTLATLSWQLYLHAAQAYLAMDRFNESLTYIEKAENQKNIPDEARAAIAELRAESENGIRQQLS